MHRWFICPEIGKKARILYFWTGSCAFKPAPGTAEFSQNQRTPTVTPLSQSDSFRAWGALMGLLAPRACAERRPDRRPHARPDEVV